VIDDPQAFDLLLTDHMMPKLSGVDLAEKVHEIRPNMPIVLMTGCATSLDIEDLRKLGVRELVGKPLRVDMLCNVLRRVIPPIRIVRIEDPLVQQVMGTRG
jgi:DNA-binding NtrC family response regulator